MRSPLALKVAVLASAVLASLIDTGVAGKAGDGRGGADRVFSDAEIADGFFKLAFGAEFRFGKRTDRIRKYDGPVRVYVDNRGDPDRRRQVGEIIADIRAHMKDLDIAVTDERSEANAVISLVRDRDLARTIRDLYGSERARRIRRAHEPQCLAGFTKDDSFRILHAEIILVVDAGDYVFFDCAYEEILQALGPINDDPSVPWTMFNDNVSMGYFGKYDQLLMNTLYDPRLRPGMTREEVRALLPAVIPEVRGFVERRNQRPE